MNFVINAMPYVILLQSIMMNIRVVTNIFSEPFFIGILVE
jgi:hypothetical protein